MTAPLGTSLADIIEVPIGVASLAPTQLSNKTEMTASRLVFILEFYFLKMTNVNTVRPNQPEVLCLESVPQTIHFHISAR